MKKKAVNISFNSLQEMSNWIEKTPRTERGEELQKSTETTSSRSSFTGTASFDEADNLMKYGDDDNAKKIQLASANVKAKTTPGESNRNRLYSSPCGFLPIVPRVLSGVPENMHAIRKEAYKNTKIINIVYNVTAGYSVEADEIIEVSAKVASVIKTLEKNGYRVNLYLACVCGVNSKTVCITVKTKDSGQYFDTLRAAYPLVNPSFLRRHLSAVLERIKEIQLPSGYGKVLSDEDAQKYLGTEAKYLSFYKCRYMNVNGILKEFE